MKAKTRWLFENDAEEFRWLREQGITIIEIARISDVKPSSLARAMHRKGLQEEGMWRGKR